MTINLNLPATHQLKPRITVVGVGGAGGNAVNNMITSHLEGVEFLVANTDAQALAHSLSERRIQLGANITQGLGAGSRPDVGRAAAEEVIEEIVDHLDGSNMVFITCGMGGGTGTGAAPVIARIGRERGILTVAVVTKPFNFEGVHRMRIAEKGIDELQQYVDTLIIIPNQNLFRVANEKTTFADAFKMADDVLYSGVRGVTDLMVMPGLINLDFADVRTVMAEMGKAMMGTGEADGDRRAVEAAESAISNPLLDDVSMRGARGLLINITGGDDMTLFEVDEAANRIREEVDPDANIIFGSTFEESLAGKVRVSVVATGIDIEEAREPVVPLALGTSRPAEIAPPAIPVFETAAAVAEQVENAPAEPELVTVGSAAESRPAHAIPSRPAPVAAGRPAPVAAGRPAPVAAGRPAQANPSRPETVAVGRPAPVAPPRPAPAVERPAPAPADRFIPPRPVDPGRRHALGGQAKAFAAAAMANGAPEPAPPAEPRRTRTLFERVTGGVRSRKAQAERRPKPQPEPELEDAVVPTTPEPEGVTLPRVEEDLLDIPAFLRRQAN